MRQDTADLNLATPAKLDARVVLVKTDKKELIARSGNVKVNVLGVDNEGKPITYWDRLHEYWIE